MLLTREQILAATQLPQAQVEVPEWGGAVIVRALTALERDRFEMELVSTSPQGTNQVNLVNARARLVAACCIDEAGHKLFAADDVAALGKLSAAALNRVYEVAAKMSGLQAGATEEQAKNWFVAPADDSRSD